MLLYVYVCYYMYMYVTVCICMLLYVYVCYYMYMYVTICICMLSESMLLYVCYCMLFDYFCTSEKMHENIVFQINLGIPVYRQFFVGALSFSSIQVNVTYLLENLTPPPPHTHTHTHTHCHLIWYHFLTFEEQERGVWD